MRAGTAVRRYRQNTARESRWLKRNPEILERSGKIARSGINTYLSPPELADRYPDPTEPTPLHKLTSILFNSVIQSKGPKHQEAVTLLGQILGRYGVNPASVNHTLLLGSDIAGKCSRAEQTFAATAQQLLGTGRVADRNWQRRVSIYHDADNVPVILRKSSDTSSGLLLRHVSIEGGLVLPQGTIVGMTKDKDLHEETGYHGQRVEHSRGDTQRVSLYTYLIDPEKFPVTPARLSPWLHDNARDRALFAVERAHRLPDRVVPVFDRERWESYGDVTMADFQGAADRIMQLCGVSSSLTEAVPTSTTAV